jgi:hypothetical protein
MHPQRPNNQNNPQMEVARQQIFEVHTEMMRVMTQDMINPDSKELPPGMLQVLDNHSRIVQMMSQILASTNNNLPQNHHGSKEPRGDAEITLQACRIYEKEEHLSRNCSRKRERFPTTVVEYEGNEVRDFLALERPKKKNDTSKVICLNCKKLRHYAKKCPERDKKVNKERRTDLVTCHKMQSKGTLCK